ncbi:hypothetical protein A3D11_01905 [Candidatus Peribacteria bacterium RIFCSPHIGHO2_02_FULL_49_16]|nr:MAG: hypothetical protein A2880_01015 [Candidatus Peribacteria bacterium RIFCSPHIGHO2_01_FULL_49_38]OGJ58670.1 MAG: hypothetical protein A3D11_01905 [Candidatus Peribacteria bacterium RIFCSPHIGHO2_02_FULL_49_16]
MKLQQAILPVAGLGTRFLPWTKNIPKEMLPIGNQPLIALLVDECLQVGITDICFVISHGKESIPKYFSADPALEAKLEQKGKLNLLEQLRRYNDVHFHTVYQEEPLGDGHAVLQAREWIKSDVVAILFGDDLYAGEKSGLEQLCHAYAGLPSGANLLCLEEVPLQRVSSYGIAAIDEIASKDRMKKIIGLVEKPSPDEAPSNFGVVGKYIIPRQTINALAEIDGDHQKEIRLIDALIKELPHAFVYGYVCEGKRLDTGTPEGYRKAIHILG